MHECQRINKYKNQCMNACQVFNESKTECVTEYMNESKRMNIRELISKNESQFHSSLNEWMNVNY